jgi:hypothetical protein
MLGTHCSRLVLRAAPSELWSILESIPNVKLLDIAKVLQSAFRGAEWAGTKCELSIEHSLKHDRSGRDLLEIVQEAPRAGG